MIDISYPETKAAIDAFQWPNIRSRDNNYSKRVRCNVAHEVAVKNDKAC
jgi:hypothetical protein